MCVSGILEATEWARAAIIRVKATVAPWNAAKLQITIAVAIDVRDGDGVGAGSCNIRTGAQGIRDVDGLERRFCQVECGNHSDESKRARERVPVIVIKASCMAD